MVILPSITELIQRTKALAALDLILSPDWQYRYHSFNSSWAPSEQMASMRNGCGDEWWMVFHDDVWAALKGLGHDSTAWSTGRETLSTTIQNAFPLELQGFAHEPAFRWDATSFGYFFLPTNGEWSYANAMTPFASLDSGELDLLQLLIGRPDDYTNFASDYYDVDVPTEVVKSFFSHQPITEAMISRLNPEIALDDIGEELFIEIGYPR